MKVLNALTLPCLLFSVSFAADTHQTLENYISTTKQKEFSYDYRKNKEDSLKLKDSWIQPATVSYTYSKSNPYKQMESSRVTSISVNQPIFQSGGIYYGIKYATASEKYNNYSIDVQKRSLIAQAISLLIQIKQSGLQQAQQRLQIDNANINLIQIKEQYLSGQVDSGSLDNAVIQKNTAVQTLFNLQTSEQKLISQFQSISDLDYKTAKIPVFTMITKQRFLKDNLLIAQQNAQVKQNKYEKYTTIAKYLPSVSLNAGYNWSTTNNASYGNSGVGYSASTDYYNYGFKVSIPIDYNSLRDVESSKLAYLKSQEAAIDQKRSSRATFEQVFANIENYEHKIKLAQESEKLYTRLLSQTQALYRVGNKTVYDVQTLQNSLNIQKIDVKIFRLDKQLSLLNLYKQLKNNAL